MRTRYSQFLQQNLDTLLGTSHSLYILNVILLIVALTVLKRYTNNSRTLKAPLSLCRLGILQQLILHTLNTGDWGLDVNCHSFWLLKVSEVIGSICLPGGVPLVDAGTVGVEAENLFSLLGRWWTSLRCIDTRTCQIIGWSCGNLAGRGTDPRGDLTWICTPQPPQGWWRLSVSW